MAELPVRAADTWASNAELIVDVARLGYLRREWSTMDVTYGYGTFWKLWEPRKLICHDKFTLDGVDFRALPHRRNCVAVAVLDPPYKLNGTPAVGEMDERYGTDGEYTKWQDRHELIKLGIDECLRVARRYVLLKCQDQVCSGSVRWQTRIFADHAEAGGASLVDSFLILGGGRAQPSKRRQVHARRNYSTMLVFDTNKH